MEDVSDERIAVQVVDNFPALGRIAALRFVRWVQSNPGGVVSLPTGKTPEHFIRWVNRILERWMDRETVHLLEQEGLDPARKPDMRGLRFVQIDEFYPIDPAQHNSFCYYVKDFYLAGFGLDPGRAMLIDCSAIGLKPGQTLASVWPDMRVDLTLRNRSPGTVLERVQKDALERVDQWCQEYEAAIRAMGGIGFFLGGIGPDGHIGFNVRGSDHFSTTRLTATNYETQAAAATDLGGIDVSRNRLVITIGLGTLSFNPSCTALIIAAGESKAKVVADAILQAPDVLYPATALHRLPNASFIITAGAARLLPRRRLAQLSLQPALPAEELERILIDVSVKSGRRLLDLTPDVVKQDPFGGLLMTRSRMDLDALKRQTHAQIEARIRNGSQVFTNARFLHTEPHHDDLMLGMLPAIVRNSRRATNTHHFVTLTSGFTAVTNTYMALRLQHLLALMDTPSFRQLDAEGYFAPGDLAGRNRDLWQYLDGIAARNEGMKQEGTARRLLRDLLDLFGQQAPGTIRAHVEELLKYLAEAYPGKKDLPEVQRLKGMCREWEAECLWGYFGWNCASVSHLRLGFYTGDVFTEEPTTDRDVPPILALVRKMRPDMISVAFDPEASGPDTHYKVMQAVRAAIEQYAADPSVQAPRVWGYRNVWYRFHPSEANVYVPVSLNMFSIMESAFMNTFISQRDASFPSHEYDGPFCGLARQIQVEQYQAIKTCLGRAWFHEHPEALIRATRGLVFLKDMSFEEFAGHSRALQHAAEAR